MADYQHTPSHVTSAIEPLTALPKYLNCHIAVSADQHWVWIGNLNKWGTPTVTIDGVEHSVLRIIYEHVFTTMPPTTWLGSDCEDPICVSPLHHSLRVSTYRGGLKTEELAIEYARCIEQAILWATDTSRPFQQRVTSFELARAYREGLEACQGDAL